MAVVRVKHNQSKYRNQEQQQRNLFKFHSRDYIECLSCITPINFEQFHVILPCFNVSDDCPIFDGMFEYFSKYAGA